MTKKLKERDNCYDCFAIESVERLAPIFQSASGDLARLPLLPLYPSGGIR